LPVPASFPDTEASHRTQPHPRRPLSHGGAVGQTWRGGGPRQARLAIALKGVGIRLLDERLGRATGELLASTGTYDVVDAALALLAADGYTITTSDIGDIAVLAEAAGIPRGNRFLPEFPAQSGAAVGAPLCAHDPRRGPQHAAT
jgi:hypothetical protein